MTATTLPIITDGSLWPLYFMGMGSEPRVRSGKASPEGEETYSTNAMVMMTGFDGQIAPDKGAALNTTNPEVYRMGMIYRASGTIFVRPYQIRRGTEQGPLQFSYIITGAELVGSLEKFGTAQNAEAPNNGNASVGAPIPDPAR